MLTQVAAQALHSASPAWPIPIAQTLLLLRNARMPPRPVSDAALATRVHELVSEAAPQLTPKTWYGMPAYANADGKTVCFFKPASKFKMRYCEFGFNDLANDLGDAEMWGSAFAITGKLS